MRFQVLTNRRIVAVDQSFQAEMLLCLPIVMDALPGDIQGLRQTGLHGTKLHRLDYQELFGDLVGQVYDLDLFVVMKQLAASPFAIEKLQYKTIPQRIAVLLLRFIRFGEEITLRHFAYHSG